MCPALFGDPTVMRRAVPGLAHGGVQAEVVIAGRILLKTGD
jgi:hypothetical protein